MLPITTLETDANSAPGRHFRPGRRVTRPKSTFAEKRCQRDPLANLRENDCFELIFIRLCGSGQMQRKPVLAEFGERVPPGRIERSSGSNRAPDDRYNRPDRTSGQTRISRSRSKFSSAATASCVEV